jgi:hypothetical protein
VVNISQANAVLNKIGQNIVFLLYCESTKQKHVPYPKVSKQWNFSLKVFSVTYVWNTLKNSALKTASHNPC